MGMDDGRSCTEGEKEMAHTDLICGEVIEYNQRMAEAVSHMSPVRLSGLEVEVKVLHDALNIEPLTTHAHEHPYYELSFMRLGEMRYQCGDNAINISVADRSVFLMPPAIPHEKSTRVCPSLIVGFMLRIQATEPNREEFVRRLPRLVEKAGYRYEWHDKLRDLPDCWREEVLDNAPLGVERVSALVGEFLISFFQVHFGKILGRGVGVNPNLRSSRATVIFDLVTGYVEEHINERITLDDIALRCGIGPRHLNRMFTSVSGSSIGSHIIRMKMEVAARMLQDNSMLVRDVALSLGYDDESYFCRLFKRVKGQTPRNSQRGSRTTQGRRER